MIHTDNTLHSNTLGNIYHMTNAAAARVYELRRGAMPRVQPENSDATTALKEIQEGKTGLSVLLDVPKKKTHTQRY
jgi:DNA-directed RNA polymerase subunit K/omega